MKKSVDDSVFWEKKIFNHMNQKGFANIIWILIIVTLAGVIGCFTLVKAPIVSNKVVPPIVFRKEYPTYINSIFDKSQYLSISFSADDETLPDPVPFTVEPRLIFLTANQGDKKSINLLITTKESFKKDNFIWVSEETLISRDYLGTTLHEVAPGTNPYSLRPWITFPLGLVRSDDLSFSRIDFERIDSYDRPDARSVNFPIEVNVPNGSPDGDYFGVLTVEIPNGPRVDILTVVRLGKPQDKLQVNSFEISSDNRITVATLQLKNLGNTVVELDGYFEINGEQFPIKESSGYQPLSKAKFILPAEEKDTTFDFSFYKKLEIGKTYQLNARLRYGDGQIMELSKQFIPRKFIGT